MLRVNAEEIFWFIVLALIFAIPGLFSGIFAPYTSGFENLAYGKGTFAILLISIITYVMSLYRKKEHSKKIYVLTASMPLLYNLAIVTLNAALGLEEKFNQIAH